MRYKNLAVVLALITTSTFAQVQNAARANRADVAEAEKFLAQLPSAFSGSHAYATEDGTVNIRIICSGSGKAMDGLVAIKNGVVTKVR